MTTQSRSWIVRLLLVSTLLMFSGATAAVAASHEQSKTTATEVKKEVAQTYEVFKQYGLEQRQEAMSAAKQQLAKLDGKLDELESAMADRWQSLSKSSRDNYRQTLKTLRQQRNEVAEWYGGMRQSSAEAWEDVKKGFAASYDRLEQSFKEASSAFQKEP